jgi:hypothetical protein
MSPPSRPAARPAASWVDTGCRTNHRGADLDVIAVAPREDAAAIVPSGRSSVTTGANSGALSAGKLSKPARAALLHISNVGHIVPAKSRGERALVALCAVASAVSASRRQLQ